jgi:Carboxypeptidase regulatory-like domain/TonB dependent receptor
MRIAFRIRNPAGSRLAAIGVLFSLAASLAWGQSQSINGTIRGQVTDATGVPVAAADITVTNDDTGFTRDVKTDSGGLYVAPDLPLGAYTVTVQSSGFAPVSNKGIRIEAGTSAVVNEQLHPGTVTTQVEVTGDAPVIEPARFDIGATIDPRETANIPLSSRNPYNFVLFQPGVSGIPNQELGIPDYVNTNGLVDRVNYELDGMQDTETDEYGLRLFAISQVYVNEVQTVSNAFAPEFGNTDGNIYNAITGSGTNSVHGMLQYIWRPSAANSRPMLLSATQPTPDSTLSNPSANVGGPIIKNKLFYYGAYEYILRGEPSPITITPTNAAEIGLPASQLGTAPEVEHAQFVDVRADWNISAKNSAFVRYNYFKNEFPYNSDVGGLYALSASSNFHDRAHIIGAQLITAFSPNLLNEFRGSWPYRNEKHVDSPSTGPGPMVYISGIAYFNGTNINGTVFQEKIPSFNDNVTWIKGSHTLKFGVGFEKPLLTQLSAIYSEFVFPSIAAYQAAQPGAPNYNPYGYSQLNVSIGHPGAGFHAYFVNAFAQDTWQIRKNVLVNYGLRYDLYQAPSGLADAPFIYTQSFRTPRADFSPRLGVAWQVTPTTVVRANIGVFYIQPPTDVWYNSLYNDGGTNSLIAQISSTSACAPAYPQTITSVSSGCLGIPSITATTPNFKNEYTWNGNLQVAQQLAKNDSLTLGYVMTNGRNIEFERNMNLINPIGYLADGRPVFSSAVNAQTRLYPQFNNITLQDVGSNSSYNALLVGYQHRWSAGFLARANYTWGHSISDAPEVSTYDCDGVIEDPTNRNRDRSDSCVDRPNAFTLSSVYEPQSHFESKLADTIIKNNQFVTTWNFLSGQPQTLFSNQVLNNDTTTSAVTRPLFVGRNSLRGPSIYQVDLRYTRGLGTWFEYIKPQLFVEANNLFNKHSNVTTLNTTAQVVPLPSAGSPIGSTVGEITTPAPLTYSSTLLQARILQFGARFQF